jgi:hypothetical protein
MKFTEKRNDANQSTQYIISIDDQDVASLNEEQIFRVCELMRSESVSSKISGIALMAYFLDRKNDTQDNS